MSGIPLPKNAIPLTPNEQEKLRRYIDEARDLEKKAAEKMRVALDLCDVIGGRSGVQAKSYKIDVEFRALIPEGKADGSDAAL